MLSTRRQLELFRDLQRLASTRQLAEEQIAGDFQLALKRTSEVYQQQVASTEQTYDDAKLMLDESHRKQMAKLTTDYETARDTTQAEYRQIREDATTRFETTVREAKAAKKQSKWQALAVFDTSKNNPREKLEAAQQSLAARQGELDQLLSDSEQILRMRRLWHAELANCGAESTAGEEQTSAADQALDSDEPATDAFAKLGRQLTATRELVEAMHSHRPSRWFEDASPFIALAGVWLVLLPPIMYFAGLSNWPVWLAGSLVGAAVIGGSGGWMLYKKMKAWARDTYQQVLSRAAATRSQIDLAAIAAREQSRLEAEQLIITRDQELALAETVASKTLVEVEAWRDQQISDAGGTFPAKLLSLRETYQADQAAEDSDYRNQLEEITVEHERQLRQAEEKKQVDTTTAEANRDAAYSAMRDEWFAGVEAVRGEFARMHAECDRLFPNWNQTNYTDWEKPSEPTDAVQFGTTTLDLTKVKHGLSADPELRPEQTSLLVPALVTLREQPSLVATAEGEGRTRAIELLQTLMVRYLTAMPPGKVRFTICDPLGLGESFSSFMHLADHDEGLINGRIWSEPRDIDQQLTRLTAHMETILQKYLRNEYESIHEYNQQAGEVAEPFQILVIANFPHGFSDTAAKRLLSLVTGGPRCGVFVLLSLDNKQRLPNDFSLEDLLAPSVHLDWDAERRKFIWRYPAFEHLPLSLPEPIENESLVSLVKQAGKLAKDSIKVEVPFSVVVPEESAWWTQECDGELAVPIGRAGANRLHYVKLGKGTSQHLLVAGKTGSGKSTFLHALVTSGAMHFGPDELEFYLVDFKKGVEFKSYATHELPHARVIAIESEREFGISVLERLDEELKSRGEKFRKAGVQNLADYRAAHPDDIVPRTLLIIDEFQELFVEDDKLAQEAGLLLDRLVRQGRAFGMHVLLGSQTLSGAYSLARSTLGQIAVRVALQCSEADAHLILSDERNEAARFLSRPGEAIYNDQNGLVAANQPFQVVWLSDSERSKHLAEIRKLSLQRDVRTPEAIVFEGNAPADPRENVELTEALSLSESASADHELLAAKGGGGVAYLGASVAIAPPTAARFASHGGSNLLAVGQQEQAALGVLTTAVISLATGQRAPATFTLLDGTREGEAGQGVWKKVADAIGERAKLVGQRGVAEAIDQIAQELLRRDSENDESAPPMYLVIHNGSRFRDLRKSEDDFSFSMDNDKPPAPDKQFAEILKNGPAFGIHTLVWCDSYNAVTRMFDRLALREFEMRVCFQMSAADSSNLLDTPAASKLSPNRALLYNDETGQAEKFRPYSMPTDEWLNEVAAAFGSEVMEH